MSAPPSPLTLPPPQHLILSDPTIHWSQAYTTPKVYTLFLLQKLYSQQAPTPTTQKSTSTIKLLFHHLITQLHKPSFYQHWVIPAVNSTPYLLKITSPAPFYTDDVIEHTVPPLKSGFVFPSTPELHLFCYASSHPMGASELQHKFSGFSSPYYSPFHLVKDMKKKKKIRIPSFWTWRRCIWRCCWTHLWQCS